MSTQMIVRLDNELKEKIDRLARKEGKNTSQLVRELIEAYVVERDMSGYIDDLWDRLGAKLAAQGVKPGDIQQAIRDVRSGK